MSAVQIPEELQYEFVTPLWHLTAFALALTSLYPRCFRTTWCSWANSCWQITSFPVQGYR